MICNRSVSSPIPIQKNNIYSLNNNIFDPNNSSPPNDFLLKLSQRSLIYGDSICIEEKNKKNEKNEKKHNKNYILNSSLEKK